MTTTHSSERSIAVTTSAVARSAEATGTTTPALFRTRTTHLRRAPVHHYSEHGGYSWYVDIDKLPRLPRWLQSFARFEAEDHFAPVETDGVEDTLRRRIDVFLAGRGIDLHGGQITALMQARVLGYGFNPLTLYWCHDRAGELRHIIAEVQNTHGEWHAYLLPPDAEKSSMVMKKLQMSPFNGVDGYYLFRAPRPDADLDVTISLHRENQPALVSTMRGARRPGSAAQLVRLQFMAPMAPLMSAFSARVQDILLRLRRVPMVPRENVTAIEKARQS